MTNCNNCGKTLTMHDVMHATQHCVDYLQEVKKNLLELLKECEWVPDEENPLERVCPSCKAFYEQGHRSICERNNYIRSVSNV